MIFVLQVKKSKLGEVKILALGSRGRIRPQLDSSPFFSSSAMSPLTKGSKTCSLMHSSLQQYSCQVFIQLLPKCSP